MLQIFIKVSGQPKHLKNVKSISNITGSHLVSCRVIPRLATVKEWGSSIYIDETQTKFVLFFNYLIHFYVFQLLDKTELLYCINKKL